MNKELRPFIHIVSMLYIKYGYKEYPLCKYEQEEVNAKDIVDYVATNIMHIQTRYRPQGKQG